MESLSAAGIPVFAERGSSGGWALSEGYRTNLTGMKPAEIMSLLLSNPSKLLNDLGIQHDFQGAFQKLIAASPITIKQDIEVIQQRLHIDGAGWHQSSELFPHLSIVQEAVWKQQKLSIQYQREKDVAERIIAPLGLVAKRSVWYVVAEVEGSLRTYRISRLLDVRALEESFDRPEQFNLAQYWEMSTAQFKLSLPRYPARVRMKEHLLMRFKQERYARVLHSHLSEDGWLDADIEFETLESACEIALYYSPFLEVMEPAELRSRVIAASKATLLLYGEYTDQFGVLNPQFDPKL
jgi:predicted DNA-binding transcriptional regulator YafY